MTTLADLTEEQRAQCRGMWAECKINGLKLDGIVSSINAICDYSYVFTPCSCATYFIPTKDITPRPDLPRAWNPDGTPPRGEWEPTE